MLIEINRNVLEQFVKDKEFMYQLITNWTTEVHEHHSWYGLGFRNGRKLLTLRSRGSTQISIKYEDHDADYWNVLTHIEKRIVKYKGKR